MQLNNTYRYLENTYGTYLLFRSPRRTVKLFAAVARLEVLAIHQDKVLVFLTRPHNTPCLIKCPLLEKDSVSFRSFIIIDMRYNYHDSNFNQFTGCFHKKKKSKIGIVFICFFSVTYILHLSILWKSIIEYIVG